MAIRSTLHSTAIAVLLLILAAVPSFAQVDAADDEGGMTENWNDSPLMKKFESQLAFKTLEHWTSRLNDYKSRIDRTVSPCDLAELNRLRVYWSMFLDEQKWKGIAEGVGAVIGEGLGETSSSTMDAYDYDTTLAADYDMYDTAVALPGDGQPADYQDMEETDEFAPEADMPETAPAYIVPDDDIDAPMPSTGTEEEYIAESAPEDEAISAEETMATVDKVSEAVETFFVAKWIARRYRPQLDEIRQSVETDFHSFFDTLLLFRDQFVRDNSAELARHPGMRQELTKFSHEDIDKIMGEARDEKWALIAYNVLIEPILLLYNGQDMVGILREVDALPAEITTLELPELSALRQNVPNPTGTTTTITYVLNTPSTSTILRLYNARGEMLDLHDLGPRTPGEYQVEIDVSKLPAGSYLYHLTVQSNGREQVHSKTMQVIH